MFQGSILPARQTQQLTVQNWFLNKDTLAKGVDVYPSMCTNKYHFPK